MKSSTSTQACPWASEKCAHGQGYICLGLKRDVWKQALEQWCIDEDDGDDDGCSDPALVHAMRFAGVSHMLACAVS